MTQPYGQQPGQQPGQYGQPGGYQQSGGYPQAPSYSQSGGLPQAPPDQGGFGGSTARPGTVTAAAVLAYVQAGITTITTILVLAGATQASGGEAALAWLVGLAQVAGIVLLIWGGVQITQGKGRLLLVIGCLVELAICVYYLINFMVVETQNVDVLEGAKAFLIAVAIFFAIMPTISLILSMGGAASQYLDAKRR
jgi:hypothetical protein